MSKFLYNIRPSMPIRGVFPNTIFKDCSMELDKDEVKKCLKNGPVFRKFSLTNLVKVNLLNLDRLHREDFIEEADWTDKKETKAEARVVEETIAPVEELVIEPSVEEPVPEPVVEDIPVQEEAIDVDPVEEEVLPETALEEVIEVLEEDDTIEAVEETVEVLSDLQVPVLDSVEDFDLADKEYVVLRTPKDIEDLSDIPAVTEDASDNNQNKHSKKKKRR